MRVRIITRADENAEPVESDLDVASAVPDDMVAAAQAACAERGVELLSVELI